ncbi:hypothetical protein NL676_029258 [Syzygium grande]|nr:hypothetical protein NL676_029258 [Syzygium grande]
MQLLHRQKILNEDEARENQTNSNDLVPTRKRFDVNVEPQHAYMACLSEPKRDLVTVMSSAREATQAVVAEKMHLFGGFEKNIEVLLRTLNCDIISDSIIDKFRKLFFWTITDTSQSSGRFHVLVTAVVLFRQEVARPRLKVGEGITADRAINGSAPSSAGKAAAARAWCESIGDAVGDDASIDVG